MCVHEVEANDRSMCWISIPFPPASSILLSITAEDGVKSGYRPAPKLFSVFLATGNGGLTPLRFGDQRGTRSLTIAKVRAGTNGRCVPLFVHWQALSPFLPRPTRSTPRPLVPDEGKETDIRRALPSGCRHRVVPLRTALHHPLRSVPPLHSRSPTTRPKLPTRSQCPGGVPHH